MKSKQLQELVKLITHKVLKEYSSFSSSNSISKDDNVGAEKPVDAMSDLERSKHERDMKRDQEANIRASKLDIQGTKKQTDYFNLQLKQNKLKQNAQNKNLQNLQAGKTISTGGAGSIPLK